MDKGERLALAVLMFYRGGRWTEQDQRDWQVLTGSADATTKALCDVAREILIEFPKSAKAR